MFKHLSAFGLVSLIITAIIVLGTFGLFLVKLFPYALLVGFLIGAFVDEIFGSKPKKEEEE